jgi:hypothetical protein
MSFLHTEGKKGMKVGISSTSTQIVKLYLQKRDRRNTVINLIRQAVPNAEFWKLKVKCPEKIRYNSRACRHVMLSE